MGLVIARLYLYCVIGKKYLADTPDKDIELLQACLKSDKSIARDQLNGYINWDLDVHKYVRAIVLPLLKVTIKMSKALPAKPKVNNASKTGVEKNLKPLQQLSLNNIKMSNSNSLTTSHVDKGVCLYNKEN